METTERFAATVHEQFRKVIGELPQDSASITETVENELWRLRLEPRIASACPLEITIEDGAGCEVYIGSHGVFEHLDGTPELIVGFLKAAVRGTVSESVWEWNGWPVRVITKVEIDDVPYIHRWSSLYGMLAKMLFGPWIRRREIQYRPYSSVMDS